MTLNELPLFRPAQVAAVTDVLESDPVSRRLRELGFVPGEPVVVVARGLFGVGPLLVQIGSTRFALRKGEASRVSLSDVGTEGMVA